MRRWICCYDVPHDGRRSRLHDAVRAYLRPVQKSVFEGDLDDDTLRLLEGDIAKIIERDEDTVRLYPLCARCLGTVRLFGLSPRVPPSDQPILL